jgi:hypothetical protein
VDRYVIRATAAGAFGTGDVTITPRANADLRSAVINVEASSVFDPSSTLSLTGLGGASTTGFYTNFDSTNRLLFLAAGTTNTVEELTVNGTPIGAGTYSGSSGFTWLGGTGTLTVSPIPEPSAAILAALGCMILMRRRR